MKKCPVCKTEKPLSEFNSQGKRCYECHREANREWRAKNPQKHLASQKKSLAKLKKEGRYRYVENKNKEKQLGMALGTACHRLRMLIMFRLIQRLREDVCFKCKNKILSAKECSIEHKTDWQNNDTSLFWDLDNIAFSHRKCNVRRYR
jgi:hypothetical protein